MLQEDELDDARSCVASLEQIDADFDELRGMFKGKTLFNEDRRSAQQKLRLLKELLASEVKRLRTAERNKRLTHIEDAYYYPAIQQTQAELSMPWNSIPDGKWNSELYGSQVSITHFLFQLKDQIPK
jgi:chaperonin cofactor prefoldin